MKQFIAKLLADAVNQLVDSGVIDKKTVPSPIPVEHARRAGQGDYATGIALALARPNQIRPRDIAAQIQQNIAVNDVLEKTEIAGAGFINFYLSHEAVTGIVPQILQQGESYGESLQEKPNKILLEFVSANPTGPLHVGHGRGAEFGDALTRVLRAAGHDVETEYYVNDLGRQMDVLCISVWIRYLQLCGRNVNFPDGAYRGDYIVDCAKVLREEIGNDAECSTIERIDFESGDKEKVLTELILLCKEVLGTERFRRIRSFVLDHQIGNIRAELLDFGVSYDKWYFESSVLEDDQRQKSIVLLEKGGYLYKSEGATWFRSKQFGDEKDRVLVRSNGDFTYFASDIAYHLNKFNRGYDAMINVWGADHHGYIARMKAALQAAGRDAGRLKILLVQFATLYRKGRKIQMSTRSGQFVSLRELMEETGKDAARFFYVLRKSEQHLDFDLELAKEQSSENPVYYVQYAHARICSVFRQISERSIVLTGSTKYVQLSSEVELNLIKRLSRYPEVIAGAANDLAPHQVAYYLRDVATDFHSFYNRQRILDSEPDLRNARVALIDATRQVLANGLGLLGVSAPQSM